MLTIPASRFWQRVYARAGQLMQRKGLRAFSHVLTGNMLVSISQAIQFLLLARALGSTEFGKIAAVSAVISVLMPFSGMGSANVMIMRAARDSALLPLYFGNALLNAIITGLLLTALAVVIVTPLLGSKIPALIVLVLCISELLFSKFIDICWQVFVSNERLHWTSVLLVAQSLSKLAAVIGFMFCRLSQASTWIWWALGSNVAIGAWTLVTTTRKVGLPRCDLALARREFLTGVPFAIGLSAKGFYTDADKIFLSRFGSMGSVATYTIAFRIAQFALVCIRAVSLSTQSRFFRAGAAGVAGSLAVSRRLTRPVLGMALLMGLCFFLAAPLVTLVAGPQYLESVTILRWLSAMPLMLAAYTLLAGALEGSGNQRFAALVQVVSAAVACLLCIVLIPRMDWRGAVMASYFSQLFLVLGSLCAVLLVRRQPETV